MLQKAVMECYNSGVSVTKIATVLTNMKINRPKLVHMNSKQLGKFLSVDNDHKLKYMQKS